MMAPIFFFYLPRQLRLRVRTGIAGRRMSNWLCFNQRGVIFPKGTESPYVRKPSGGLSSSRDVCATESLSIGRVRGPIGLLYIKKNYFTSRANKGGCVCVL